jgi:hypothetical protein
LRVDCVSRPSSENFRRFLHNHSDFQADCVSRGLPGNFRQWIARKRLARPAVAPNALTQAALAVVLRVLLTPTLAGPPMPLSLATRRAAHALATTRSTLWLEPPAAHTARPLARHRCLLEEGQRAPSRLRRERRHDHHGWVISREHTRVISSER